MKEQQKLNILLAVLILLLVISLSFFIFQPTKKPNEFIYNGFVVSRFRLPSAPAVIFHGIDLEVGKQRFNIPIRSNPLDIESIDVSGLNKVSWLSKSDESSNYDILANQVYVTFNPEEMTGGDVIIAGGEIIRVIGTGAGSIYKIPISGAFTKDINESSTDVVTCSDASSSIGVILLQLGDESKVYAMDDCLIVQGRSYSELIMSSDRLLLALLGVIDV